MERILGIDTGTNSLGWAIIEKNDKGETRLLHKGTNIFTEGVKIEKGIELSKAAERTTHRALRRQYWRRKVRKIRLLTVLVENRLCPPVDSEQLREWKLKKVYPHDEEFLAWQLTEDKNNVNPYQFRHICLTQKLDLNNLTQRYILGRALYHINQRRGFLSNRKETTKASDGAVSEGISTLTAEMNQAGCQYLGEYFYQLYQSGQKIRGHYTARNEHYLNEFYAICEKQQLPEDLVKKLERAIFFQRPLKSQKGTVGTCTFEKGKARCPASHPLYEEFRLYSFLNNIKIKTPQDAQMRYLNGDEKATVLPLFKKYRKSKHTFNFEEIAKKLAGKNKYMYFRDKEDKPFQFNYQMDTPVPISTVTAQLEGIFGDNWLEGVCEVYGKTPFQIMNDVWHALFFYDDSEKLKDFAINRLQLNEEDAERFANISMPNDYASLSLKAIRKILPFLKDYGLIYSLAVFMANLDAVLPAYFMRHEDEHQKAINEAVDVLLAYDSKNDDRPLERYFKDYLMDRYEEYGLCSEELQKLYHPSMLEQYPRVLPNKDGIYQLGSPRISSVRNPMAMRSMFRLRKVVNLLLAKGYIDENTKVHIEFSRDLNDANRRWAIQQWQRQQEKNREEIRKRIQEDAHIENPTDNDILKYQLWEEQNHICIYTGNQIGISDFLCSNPKYDIEHTVPQSAGGDSTKMNLTLCESGYNRKTKKTKLPSELPNHEEMLQRIEHWNERAEDLSKRIRKLKGSRATTKEEKDNIIRRRHLLSLERDYWRGKYLRFTMREVPEGFSRRQGTDISVISRYARMFLKSVFKKVYIVKGIATSDFRKMWGIQEEYTAKERINHVHHCIDAITIACIDKTQYDKLAQFYHDEDNYRQGKGKKPQFEKPWPTFVADMKHIQDELLIAHYTKDNMPKHTRKKNGYIIVQDKEQPEVKLSYIQGDTARGSLHNDTYYGAIERDGDIKYVVRKSLDMLDAKDVDKIVDEEVKHKVKEAIATHGSLKAAVEATIWMNEGKQIPIKKVRVFAGSVTRPINIRKHRDKSRHEYKQQFHVQNDRNYMMAIYAGQDERGRDKRAFELISNIKAANFYRKSEHDTADNKRLVPDVKNGLLLKDELRIGTMVLLYENNPDEIWNSNNLELQRRLYKVVGLSSMVIQSRNYGIIAMIHHQDARPNSMIKLKNGAYNSGEEFRPGIKMLHTQFKALVQGVDFDLNDLGEISRLR